VGGRLEFQMNFVKSIAVGLAAALLSILIIVAGVSARAFSLVRKYSSPEGDEDASAVCLRPTQNGFQITRGKLFHNYGIGLPQLVCNLLIDTSQVLTQPAVLPHFPN